MKMTNWVNMLKGDFSGLKKEAEVDKISESQIYRIQWANGQTTKLANHSEVIKQINEQMNRLGWKWMRVINTETKQQQVVMEPSSQGGRGFLHLKKLNTNMLKTGE